jgi:chromosome segregation ATPase
MEYLKEATVTEQQNHEKQPRRDVLAELEARIDAAIEEARPKFRKALEELDARVDSAVKELRPRVDDAMEDVKPRVDRFVADVQPRLDGLLEKVQAKIAELRRELEQRAARSDRAGSDVAALPRTGETTDTPGTAEGGPDTAAPGGEDPMAH